MPDDVEALEREFHDVMLSLYDRAKKATGGKYRPVRFLGAVRRHGGRGWAKRALKKKGGQAGLDRLRREGRTDISLEAEVVKPRFRVLFTPEELAEAQQRLDRIGYKLPTDGDGQ